MAAFSENDWQDIRGALKVMQGMADDRVVRMEAFGETDCPGYAAVKEESARYARLIEKVTAEEMKQSRKEGERYED